MDDAQQLESIRRLALAQLADLHVSPKPSYSIDGQSVSWQSYLESLQKTIDWCDAKLGGSEPWEVQSQAVT